MMQRQTTGTPYLVVLTPGSNRDRRIVLAKGHLLVGRATTSDVHIDDSHVSRTHAALWQRDDGVYVQDLGSLGGTFVNGVAVTAPHQLHPGDVVAFATIKVRYLAGEAVADETAVIPAQTTAAPPLRAEPIAPPVHFGIGEQQAKAINNVEGNQRIEGDKNYYIEKRENFLRDIAATKTKARWLVWTGLLLYVVGFGLFAAGILGFMKQGNDAIESGDFGPPTHPFGRPIAGIPSGLLGWALAGLGTLLLIVGIVLHVVATSRRRRVDRELPVSPPWRVPGQRAG